MGARRATRLEDVHDPREADDDGHEAEQHDDDAAADVRDILEGAAALEGLVGVEGGEGAEEGEGDPGGEGRLALEGEGHGGEEVDEGLGGEGLTRGLRDWGGVWRVGLSAAAGKSGEERGR